MNFDYYKICKCQYFLGFAESSAHLLFKLASEGQNLVAYQIACDIVDNENQKFQSQVLHKLSAIEAGEHVGSVEKLK